MAARRSDSSRRRKSETAKSQQTSGERSWLGWIPQARLLLGDNQAPLELISSQLRGLRNALEKQVESASATLERRAETLLADLEARAARRLGPVFTRAEVLSKSDLLPVAMRLARIEEEIARVVGEQNSLAIKLGEVEREWKGLRPDLAERLEEASEKIADTDLLRSTIENLRQHLNTLSKEQVAKGVEVSRLHDRVLRLEMRFADISREHQSLAGCENSLSRRVALLEKKLADESVDLAGSVDDLVGIKREIQDLGVRVRGLSERRQLDRNELEKVAGFLKERESNLDARLADIADQQKRAGAALAGVTAKLREIEEQRLRVRQVDPS